MTLYEAAEVEGLLSSNGFGDVHTERFSDRHRQFLVTNATR
jgi:hypothetical protein